MAILKEFLIALQPVLFVVLMVRAMTEAVGPLILPLGGVAFIGLVLWLWLRFKP